MNIAEVVFDFTALTMELAGLAGAIVAACVIVFVAAMLVFGLRRCLDLCLWVYDMVMFSSYDREEYGTRDEYHRHQQWLRERGD